MDGPKDGPKGTVQGTIQGMIPGRKGGAAKCNAVPREFNAIDHALCCGRWSHGPYSKLYQSVEDEGERSCSRIRRHSDAKLPTVSALYCYIAILVSLTPSLYTHHNLNPNPSPKSQNVQAEKVR